MKTLKYFFISIAIFASSIQAFAHDHAHQPKHNMILFGESSTYYASHIVYKVPHNYQVLLKLNLDASTKTKISSEMQAFPGDQFIYLLDSSDISQIQSKPMISGEMFRVSSDGVKHVIFESVHLNPTEYSVLYFNELPLSLKNSEMTPHCKK